MGIPISPRSGFAISTENGKAANAMHAASADDKFRKAVSPYCRAADSVGHWSKDPAARAAPAPPTSAPSPIARAPSFAKERGDVGQQAARRQSGSSRSVRTAPRARAGNARE